MRQSGRGPSFVGLRPLSWLSRWPTTSEGVSGEQEHDCHGDSRGGDNRAGHCATAVPSLRPRGQGSLPQDPGPYNTGRSRWVAPSSHDAALFVLCPGPMAQGVSYVHLAPQACRPVHMKHNIHRSTTRRRPRPIGPARCRLSRLRALLLHSAGCEAAGGLARGAWSSC